MANFNTREWYHLYVNQNASNALIGAGLNGHSGPVFGELKDLASGRQRWQIFPINETYYVLRTKEGGPNAFLGTFFTEEEDTPGKTRPRMIRGNESDDSIFWRITPWGDGTFFMSNKQNKTDWHLARKRNALYAMDSNITSKPNGQRWSFDDNTEIKIDGFSTVDVSIGQRSAVSSTRERLINPVVTGYPSEYECTGCTLICHADGPILILTIRWNVNGNESGDWSIDWRRGSHCASRLRPVVLAAAAKTRSTLTGREVNRTGLAWFDWGYQV
jgi:hypothetical protein